jgi:hypothetical protein
MFYIHYTAKVHPFLWYLPFSPTHRYAAYRAAPATLFMAASQSKADFAKKNQPVLIRLVFVY